jgi:lipid-A-disaccharide synthase
MNVLIVTEEASASLYAARLAHKLLERGDHVFLSSDIGMQEPQLSVVSDIPTLSAFGLVEAFSSISQHISKLRQLLQFIREKKPDRIVLIDYGGFNLILAWLLRENLSPDWFIPPKVWAWGGFRASLISRFTRRIHTIFPFEKDFYLPHGGIVSYVGHPLLEIVKPWRDTPKNKNLIVLLPGSRPNELAFSLERLLETTRLLRTRNSELEFSLLVAERIDSADLRLRCQQENITTVEGDDRYPILAAASLAIAVSGTVVLEAALLNTPVVAFYSLKPFSLFLVRRWLKARFVTLPNIVLNTNAVPELLGEDIPAEQLAEKSWTLLTSESQRRYVLASFARLWTILGGDGVFDRCLAALDTQEIEVAR